ncbi:hypothetical protein P153DRAFT_153918 [Dothidotthia symphoricarpi CBS 119687]|uniref:C3H1-type domain-containing protein n=1 Tax=Dothidotthia symphoricarpi CBS 119687 TaxID=1392245 RepID=A0A6A6AMT5_9PLEO|nr:uncharacterized protein P153DRAFT_153918 [Dothidotthia symphoricarpi CBS 119687]KAF2133292.1 hypothetical protein P153DRAFT_153918 [Dothidotthia symphoricarpi CBS 119687]
MAPPKHLETELTSEELLALDALCAPLIAALDASDRILEADRHAFENSSRRLSTVPLCKDFQNGRCWRGNTCKFNHVSPGTANALFADTMTSREQLSAIPISRDPRPGNSRPTSPVYAATTKPITVQRTMQQRDIGGQSKGAGKVRKRSTGIRAERRRVKRQKLAESVAKDQGASK